MAGNSPVIVVQSLTKRFGDFIAVDSVQFKIQRGEIFGFLGPNGSGKTTTIRMMLGLMKPTSGSVEVLGMQVNGKAIRIRPRVGYMSQRFSLYNDLTVRQNLRFYGAAYGVEKTSLEERMRLSLHMAGLEGRENVRTRDLSGGWRQRLALSAAILHHPEILFLDEPTAGVDPISRRAFWDLLYELVSDGVTVFVTTHYMDEAEHCHRLAFIQHGSIIACGSPLRIKNEVMKGRVLEISLPDPITAVRILREAQQNGTLPLQEVELFGSLIHVVAPNSPGIHRSISAELRKANLDPGSAMMIDPSLEDVFIASMKMGEKDAKK